MRAASARLLHEQPAPSAAQEQQPPVMAVDSDMVVILASFLCALICVLGLALVSRCACRPCWRRSSDDPAPAAPTPRATRGLKKKAIEALPTTTATGGTGAECAVCLAEFAGGEALRVLPRCGHAFHVARVDAWLRTRATCPSCRAAIASSAAPVVACGTCGHVLPPAPGAAGPDQYTFLP